MAARRLITSALVFATLSVLVACAVTDSSPRPMLDKGARWVVLPFANFAETPQAGLRAEAIAESLMRTQGVTGLQRYPAAPNSETLFEPAEPKVADEALKWAKERGFRYALTGSVSEWRYKVGVDGEPAVGFTLQIIDVDSGAVAWNAVGAKTGWSRESVAAVAQKLMRELLASARFR